MDDVQREEREEEIGILFPLLELLWDDGKFGISTTEAEVGAEDRGGGGGGSEEVGGDRHVNGNENGVGNNIFVDNGLDNGRWEEGKEEIGIWSPM